MADITVKLSKIYKVHDLTFDSVVMREPTFKDIYVDAIGVPEELQPNGRGGVLIITNYEVVGQYVERLAVKPTSDCLLDLSVHDSKALEKAVIGFFREPKDATESQTS